MYLSPSNKQIIYLYMGQEDRDQNNSSFTASFKEYTDKLRFIKIWLINECKKLRSHKLTYYDIAMHDDIPVVVAELNDRFDEQILKLFGKKPNKSLFKQC